jgi:hypothetical protein
MVARSGQLKVLTSAWRSWLKQLHRSPGKRTTTETPALTRVGTIVGTTAHVSRAGAEIRWTGSDIFSLGVVLRVIDRRKAFAGPSVVDVLHAIINAAPRPAIVVNPELPVEVLDLFDKALARIRPTGTARRD